MDSHSNSESIVSPHRIEALPELTVLAPTRAIANTVFEAAQSRLKERELSRSWSERLIADSVPLRYCPSLAIAGPALGAPAAAIAIETLAASGIKRLVLLSICGGILSDGKELSLGTVVFPRAAMGDDGTSARYDTPDRLEFTLSPLQCELETECLKVTPSVSGAIWTTDAPYRESRELLSSVSKSDVVAIDMEFRAVLTLTKFHGIELGALFVVSDILGRDWKPGLKRPEVKNALERAACIVVNRLLK